MNHKMIPQWRRLEIESTSEKEYENPLQDVKLEAALVGGTRPSHRRNAVGGGLAAGFGRDKANLRGNSLKFLPKSGFGTFSERSTAIIAQFELYPLRTTYKAFASWTIRAFGVSFSHTMTESILPNYFAYLLRLWRTDENGKWRATLQNPHTGQLLRFESVETLFDYLVQELGATPQEPTGPWLPAEQPPLSDSPSLNISPLA